MPKRIIGFSDKVFTERSAKDTLEMLFSQLGEFKRGDEIKKRGTRFLKQARTICADNEVSHKELENLIKSFKKEKIDLISALLGTLRYQFKNKKNGAKSKFVNEIGQIPSEGLSVISANLMRYFFIRMCELSEEVGLIDKDSFYRLWRFKRGLRDLFMDDVKNLEGKLETFRHAEAGARSEAKTLKFFLYDTQRGGLVGGIDKEAARDYVIALCNRIQRADEALDLVTKLGTRKLEIREKGTGGAAITSHFDFTRFLVGLNAISELSKAEKKKLQRPLQVLVGQMLFVFMIRFSYHFKTADLQKSSPNRFDIRDVRLALEGLYGLTSKQVRGNAVSIAYDEKAMNMEEARASYAPGKSGLRSGRARAAHA
ncbi:MAG: hypothetical protein ABIF92_02010 [archaeon]